MANYAKQLPNDKAGNVMQEFNVLSKALATTAASTNISSLLTFNDNTTTIEVASPVAPVAIRWVPTSESGGTGSAQSVATGLATANFDHIIPTGTVRRFVIPIESSGTSSIVGANIAHGLYRKMAFVPTTTAVSSVLVTQY